MKAMPAQQRGCMKMSETVLEDQGVNLHVFEGNTNTKYTITKLTNMKYKTKVSELISVHSRNTQSLAAC